MPDDKLSRKVEFDTTDFKAGTAAMNRELRLLESGFRASSAELGDWANNATGLEMRIKTLNSQMDIQRQKVEATRAEWERIKAEKGETSRAATDLEIKLNKETETLGKMQNELNGTEASLQEMQSGTDQAGDSVEESGKQAEEATGKWEGFKSVVGGIGSVVKGAITVVAGLAVAVASVGASIGALVVTSADAAAELVDMSVKTGINTTRLQELDYIANQTGTTLETITGSNARLIRSMASAQEQTGAFKQKLDEANADPWDNLEEGDVVLGDMAKAFQELGVSVTDSNGDLRSNQDVFDDVIDALGQIENPTLRDALAMQIFGKSAQELNPLIKTGADGMADLAEQAHEVGAVMSEEDVAALEAFDDSMASLQAGLKGTLGTLSTAFLPGFEQVFDMAGGYLQDFKGIVESSDGDIGKIAEGVGGLVGEIVTDLASQAPQLLDAGLGLIESLLGAIITALPTLLPAAVSIITSLLNFVIASLPMLISAGVDILLTLVNALVENLPMLIDAGLQAIIALALGLAAALPELIPTIVQALLTIVQTLVENIPMLIDAALQLILGLAQGLIAALPILIPYIPVIISSIIDALMAALPMIASSGGELLGSLAMGLVMATPLLLDAAIKILETLFKTLTSKKVSFLSVGKDFINGLVEGVKNAAGLLYDAVAKIAQNMINTILGVFDQHSPSRVGIGIGSNFFTSIGMGGMEALAGVENTFAMATRRLSYAAENGFPAGGAASASYGQTNNNESYAFYAPVYLQNASSSRLNEQIKNARRY